MATSQLARQWKGYNVEGSQSCLNPTCPPGKLFCCWPLTSVAASFGEEASAGPTPGSGAAGWSSGPRLRLVPRSQPAEAEGSSDCCCKCIALLGAAGVEKTPDVVAAVLRLWLGPRSSGPLAPPTLRARLLKPVQGNQLFASAYNEGAFRSSTMLCLTSVTVCSLTPLHTFTDIFATSSGICTDKPGQACSAQKMG
jgi:hypothetical protein